MSKRRRKPATPLPTSNDNNMNYYADEEEDKMYNRSCSLMKFCLNPCWCLYQSYGRWKLQIMKQRQKQKNFLMILTLGCICGMFLRSSLSFPRNTRRLEVHLLIPKFYASQEDNVGGWKRYHSFFLPDTPVDPGPPDRDELQFQANFGSPRNAGAQEEELAETNWNQFKLSKPRFNDNYAHADDIADIPNQECTRVDWKHLYRPTCNNMHELDLLAEYPSHSFSPLAKQDSFYIAHGYFRDVWVLEDTREKTILKVSRYEHDFGTSLHFGILRDALVMERLTHSPRIIDIYSHCGTAVQVEPIPYEMEKLIIPGEGWLSEEDLANQKEDAKSNNDYTATEKLEIALSMAESLADLHGFPDGVIVHDDVQLPQWLRKKDGSIVLGDFNRAEIMDYNRHTNEYCKYKNGPGFGNYRAPEEFANRPLDESIDIWSFGNNIYALLTGLWVFYENDDDGVIHKRLIKGELAKLDPRYSKRSYPEQVLVKLLKRCWKYKPAKRIDIFETVDILQKAVAENKRLKGPGTDEAPALEEEPDIKLEEQSDDRGQYDDGDDEDSDSDDESSDDEIEKKEKKEQKKETAKKATKKKS